MRLHRYALQQRAWMHRSPPRACIATGVSLMCWLAGRHGHVLQFEASALSFREVA
jgi:hypothetical protein